MDETFFQYNNIRLLIWILNESRCFIFRCIKHFKILLQFVEKTFKCRLWWKKYLQHKYIKYLIWHSIKRSSSILISSYLHLLKSLWVEIQLKKSFRSELERHTLMCWMLWGIIFPYNESEKKKNAKNQLHTG